MPMEQGVWERIVAKVEIETKLGDRIAGILGEMGSKDDKHESCLEPDRGVTASGQVDIDSNENGYDIIPGKVENYRQSIQEL